MKKKSICIFLGLVLTGTGIGLFLSDRDSRSDGAVAQGNEPAQHDLFFKPQEDKVHTGDASGSTFCAPGSTVYLTQNQQEYKLGERGPNPPDVKRAKQDGAKAKVSLRVVDFDGVPVPDADILVAFVHRGSHPVRGKSDKNGFFTAEHMSESDVHFHVSKEGYYKTFRNYWFYREGKQCAKDGRWIPWNPTLEIVLKEKRQPTELVSKRVKLFLPKKDEMIGFDCFLGDLVKPYGTGENADLLFMYSSDLAGVKEWRSTNMLVVATSRHGGIYQASLDKWSRFPTLYTAPDDAYQPDITFWARWEGKAVRKTNGFPTDNYLIFKSRVCLDENGNEVSSHYGTIFPFNFDYGEAPLEKGEGRVEFEYRFNATPNDRNLESDRTATP